MEPAGAILGIGEGAARRIAVVGCGGKTTWIEACARAYGDKKVLITPTTRIYPPGGAGITVRTTLEACAAHRPHTGMQCLGVLDPDSGKLMPLPPPMLERILPEYDIALMEADGSRGCPLKGWRADEPVIPAFCDMTVGILTLEALGMPLSEDIALRLPLFMRLTGMRPGEPVSLHALSRMVCDPQGMFRRGGPCSLFINKVRDEATAAMAETWLIGLRAEHPGRFFALAYGSARENRWRRV